MLVNKQTANIVTPQVNRNAALTLKLYVRFFLSRSSTGVMMIFYLVGEALNNLYEAMKASSSVFPCTYLRCRHEPPGEFVSNSLNRLSCLVSY
jgi:hypothetical protein